MTDKELVARYFEVKASGDVLGARILLTECVRRARATKTTMLDAPPPHWVVYIPEAV